MARRVRVKVNLEPAVAEVLDALAEEIGRDELVPRPSRSDLLNKAALLYIGRARKRKGLRLAIERVEARYDAESSEKRKLLRVVATGRVSR